MKMIGYELEVVHSTPFAPSNSALDIFGIFVGLKEFAGFLTSIGQH
jgi:hypothetical protein